MAMAEKTKKERNSSQPKPRLNVVLSAADKKRINDLVQDMGADNVTDVTKDAFRLLEFLQKKASNGCTFYIQEPGKEPAILEIFGITTR